MTRETNGKVPVQDGADLIQTGSSEGREDLDSSLEVECTRVGVQVDRKDEGEIFGLCDWVIRNTV